MKKAISCQLLAVSQSRVRAHLPPALRAMASVHFLIVACLGGCNEFAAGPAGPAGRAEEEGLHVRVEETFRLSDGEDWLARTPALWKVADEGGRRYLQMSKPPVRPALAGVGRPQEYAIYRQYEFRTFSLSCFVRVDRPVEVPARDACIIFGRQDDTHLYYVHLSGLSDASHNTIVRVDGQTRRRLTADNFNPKPIFTDTRWHKVDVLRDADTGRIQVYVDAFDQKTAKPYFEMTDKTYEWGAIALGSFDDYASFANILIEGEARKPAHALTADSQPAR